MEFVELEPEKDANGNYITMEKSSKRKWMQSVNGKIRVGPEYQAMIPPFCRISDPSRTVQVVERIVEPEDYNIYSYEATNVVEDKIPEPRDKSESTPESRDKSPNPLLVAEDFLISH
ncbi:uncharacterized protein BXIN_0154 [Babesia sp. Xinjiang]|uniref:uncharacterized protein n=1 Tax=Babesia sp. Xinjiang TaxID=462227 RepID=UPI000A23142F|nr:uncharacterized protein BXIN_0154 [Babesia sp. Xinjiang]ORM39759.1 hypothetical protein BXIN_0154 [Babesia sp. Xinjiang]